VPTPDQNPTPAGAPRPGWSVLFVCTGNTCRSPLAEAICKRLLADRLGCDPAELEARGYVVRSAGVSAYPDDPAAPPAVEVAREHGADLSAHRSRPVDPELLAGATHVVAMTRGHAVALAMRFPGIGPEPDLLCGPDDDLGDPIGGDLELYRACARVIRGHLERLLPAWLAGRGRGQTDRAIDRPERTGTMKIAVGNDHRGVAAKQRVVAVLKELGHEVIDLGAQSAQSVDYPDFAIPVAEAVAAGKADRGVLICATGHGMCIAANKVYGIRAANCRDLIDAEMSRLHNDANVMCLSADLISEDAMARMVRTWLETKFEGSRHARRLGKISKYEQDHSKK